MSRDLHDAVGETKGTGLMSGFDQNEERRGGFNPSLGRKKGTFTANLPAEGAELYPSTEINRK